MVALSVVAHLPAHEVQLVVVVLELEPAAVEAAARRTDRSASNRLAPPSPVAGRVAVAVRVRVKRVPRPAPFRNRGAAKWPSLTERLLKATSRYICGMTTPYLLEVEAVDPILQSVVDPEPPVGAEQDVDVSADVPAAAPGVWLADQSTARPGSSGSSSSQSLVATGPLNRLGIVGVEGHALLDPAAQLETRPLKQAWLRQRPGASGWHAQADRVAAPAGRIGQPLHVVPFGRATVIMTDPGRAAPSSNVPVHGLTASNVRVVRPSSNDTSTGPCAVATLSSAPNGAYAVKIEATTKQARPRNRREISILRCSVGKCRGYTRVGALPGPILHRWGSVTRQTKNPGRCLSDRLRKACRSVR